MKNRGFVSFGIVHETSKAMRIQTFFQNHRDEGLLVLRLGVGLTYFYVHGLPKLLGGPEQWARVGASMQHLGIDFLPTFWGFMAAFAETFGGLCFALGLFFRPMTFLLAFTMLVATIRHLATGDGLRGAAHAMKMFFVFTGFLFIEPGKYSLDAWLSQKSMKERT